MDLFGMGKKPEQPPGKLLTVEEIVKMDIADIANHLKNEGAAPQRFTNVFLFN